MTPADPISAADREALRAKAEATSLGAMLDEHITDDDCDCLAHQYIAAASPDVMVALLDALESVEKENERLREERDGAWAELDVEEELRKQWGEEADAYKSELVEAEQQLERLRQHLEIIAALPLAPVPDDGPNADDAPSIARAALDSTPAQSITTPEEK